MCMCQSPVFCDRALGNSDEAWRWQSDGWTNVNNTLAVGVEV